ncbi:hypothetical protein DASC09_053580 [Saccharomycopsis crataegensis]|uniref:Cytochrome b2, mitochondrial n=1 Tax=Saccharomycopsis crataegensis TaxID=43959 RepID=A0AAV5QT73_9ASCO|nr:hypothetical protein DASC09_053580 [Saccharomycopsis crataegensis]
MTISIEQVSQHNSKTDCWIIFHSKVYDITNFVSKHPGGAKILMKLAGKDGSAQFDKFHTLDIMKSYIYEKLIIEVGSLDDSAAEAAVAEATIRAKEEAQQEASVINKYEPQRISNLKNKPPLDQIMNLYDFEYVANKTLEPVARNYYSSGVDDEITVRENHFAYKRIFFNPRVLIDVTECDISTNLLGHNTSAPFYVSSTAMQKYAHPEGEKVFAHGCSRENIVQMVPCLSSYPFEEISKEIKPGTPFWFQLYPSAHDGLNEEIIRKVEAAGCTGIFITVDNVYGGNREKDRRVKAIMGHLIELEKNKGSISKDDMDRLYMVSSAKSEDQEETKDDDSALGRRAVTWLTWEKMRHLKSITKMKFYLKGIQSIPDARLAVENGMDGIVLSNHGGRQAEYSKSTIEVLYDLNQAGITTQIDVFIDGGVRRGTDILKALCLGAKAVGLGRGLLYPVATYGEAGLVRAIQMLKEEMVTTMRNIGVRNLNELNEELIDTINLKSRGSNFGYSEDLYNRASLPLLPPNFGNVKL